MSTFSNLCRLYVENSIDNQLDVELPTFKSNSNGKKFRTLLIYIYIYIGKKSRHLRHSRYMGIRKRIKVRYTKLGREKSWGMAHYDENVIELDERLRGKKHLEIMLHETLHLLLPAAMEEEVERISINLTNMLWRDGYRKFDNSTDLPMQDGKK